MKLFALATLVSTALALTACGDDKDPSDDTTGSPTGDPTGNTMTDATTTDATTTDAMPTTTTDPTMTDPTTSDGTTTDPTTSGALSFATDVWDPILSPSCSCHQLGSSGGLMMGSDAASAYTALVGVASTGSPLSYVEAGSADMSYVYHKVNNTHVEAGGAGSRMPLGGMLSADQITTIKDWIDGGAMP